MNLSLIHISLEAVDAGKQRVISRCALQYLAEHKMEEVPCRFDAVGICGTQVTLVKNAFEWQP